MVNKHLVKTILNKENGFVRIVLLRKYLKYQEMLLVVLTQKLYVLYDLLNLKRQYFSLRTTHALDFENSRNRTF